MRTNKYSQPCTVCGRNVPAGAGELYQWLDDDDDKLVWLVKHLDKMICTQNKAIDAAAEKAAADRKWELECERWELVASLTRETGQPECIDWSWDDFRYSVGKAIRETDHYRAHEYSAEGRIIGFTIQGKDRS